MTRPRRIAAHHQCRSQGLGKSSLGVIWFGSWVNPPVQSFTMSNPLNPDTFASYRPFYATVLGPNSITMSSGTQPVMDQQIAYAKAGGIDYFAFDTYIAGATGSGPATTVAIQDSELFNYDLKLYLASAHKGDVKFCILWIVDPGDASLLYSLITPRYLNQMADPAYMKVLGRPLIYFNGIAGLWGGFGKSATRAWIDDLRAQTIARGLPNPYIVDSQWFPGSTAAADMGLDAICGYGSGRYGGKEADYRVVPYSDLVTNALATWDAERAAGLKVVPDFACGQDNRPYWPTVADMLTLTRSTLVSNATDEEWANVARLAINWNQAHPTVGEANTVLMYSWSEFGEGGKQICPTLIGGTSRLDALRSMLNYL